LPSWAYLFMLSKKKTTADKRIRRINSYIGYGDSTVTVAFGGLEFNS